jgi:hypothetical protein
VHLNCFVQEQQAPHPDDTSAQTVVLEFGEVRLMALRVDDSMEDPELFTNADEYNHGVTLPHSLDYLKGWDPMRRSLTCNQQMTYGSTHS